MSDILTAQLVAANQNRRTNAREQLLNAQPQQVVPQPLTGNAQNPIGLISEGLAGSVNALTAPERRRIEQGNLDAAAALLQEQQNYERGIASQERDDRLAAQQLDEAFRRDQLDATRDYNTRSLDLQEARLKKESRPPMTRQVILNEEGQPVGSMDKSSGYFYNVAGDRVDDFASVGNVTDGRGNTIDPTTGYDPSWNDEQVEFARGGAQDFETAQGVLDVLDTLGVPDYEAAGGKSTYAPNWLTGAADGQSKFEQLGGIGFLENISSFEGKGALSDAEGRAIRQAYSGIFDEDGLKTGVSESEVFRATETIRQNMEIASAKAAQIERLGRPLTSQESSRISAAVTEENPIREWNTYRTGGYESQSNGSATNGSTANGSNDYSNLW